MLGEQEAIVLEVRPFDLHGVRYADLKVAYRDRRVDEARLGPEGFPADLAVGEEVLVTKAANMIVSVRRR